MHQGCTSTAVLIFSRYEREEALSKPLLPHSGRRANLRLAREMIGTTEKVAHASGLTVIRIGSGDQQGSTFGERFADAFQQVFQKGFERVIAIGNDSPGLRPDHLVRAATVLRSGQGSVLGPAMDGGAYLIGIDRSRFEPKTFAQLPWCTSRVMEALRNWFRRDDLQVVELEPLKDLDHHGDLMHALHSLPWRMLNLLRELLWCGSYTDRGPVPLIQSSPFLSSHALRGPPRIPG